MTSDDVAKGNSPKLWREHIAIWRKRIADWLAVVSIACLITGPIVLAFLYWYAWQQGLYPNPDARPVEMGGPWRYSRELSRGAFIAWDPPIYAFLFSLLSMIAKPSKRAAIVLGLSLVFSFVAFAHIGLVVD